MLVAGLLIGAILLGVVAIALGCIAQSTDEAMPFFAGVFLLLVALWLAYLAGASG